MLTTRREELHQYLLWAQELQEPAPDADEAPTPLQEFSRTLLMTPAEISRALELQCSPCR